MALQALVQKIKEEGAAKRAAREAQAQAEREARKAADSPEYENPYGIERQDFETMADAVQALLEAGGSFHTAGPIVEL